MKQHINLDDLNNYLKENNEDCKRLMIEILPINEIEFIKMPIESQTNIIMDEICNRLTIGKMLDILVNLGIYDIEFKTQRNDYPNDMNADWILIIDKTKCYTGDEPCDLYWKALMETYKD